MTDTLCYVINQGDTALVTPNPTCGDSSLRRYLYGDQPTRSSEFAESFYRWKDTRCEL